MAFDERKNPSSEAALRSVMRSQMGLVTRTQANAIGLSDAAITRRAHAGRWLRVLPGVYRDVMAPVGLRQSCFAAVLWAGDGALVSHAAAGSLWGLDAVETRRPELWVPPVRRPRAASVTVHRGEVESIDRRMIGPIPLTSPARTLIDLAGVLEEEALHAAVEDAIHRGITTPTSIARRLHALGGKGRSGAARLRAILVDRGTSAAAESRLEVKIWRTLRAAGMRPVRQYVVLCGELSYRIDFAFPQWRIGVEGVGDAYHRGAIHRRRDHARLADLASISWRVIPVTWDAITRAPAQVVEQVLRALADAA